MSDEPEPIEPTLDEPAISSPDFGVKTLLENEPTIVDQDLPSTGDVRPTGSSLGRFYDLELLGEGGIGRVLQAIDPTLEREVAIKILRPELAADTNQVQRFRNEARITAQLEHPGIIPVHEAGQTRDGRVFFVMKKVQGQTFGEVLGERAVPIARSSDLQTLIRVCDALAFAHAQGIVHRDLKPENIMIGAFGEVLVMDWGLARSLKKAPEETRRGEKPIGEDPLQTLDGTVIGTIAYMSPEQARGEIDRIEPLSDLYSLGAILYEITTGTPPVDRGPTRERLQQVAGGQIEPPSARAPASNVAPELESIVLRAMALKKSDRYPTVVAFRDDLQHFLEHRPVVAAHYNPAQLLAKWLRRNRRIVFTALVVLALAGMAVGLAAWRDQQRTETRFRELLEEARRALNESGDLARFDPLDEIIDPTTGSEREESPREQRERQATIQQYLGVARLLERALQIHPKDAALRRERAAVGRATGLMALGGRNHLLAREAFERLEDFGVGREEIEGLLVRIETSKNARLSWRGDRLRFFLGRIAGKPQPIDPRIVDQVIREYTWEAIRFREPQTVRILAEELKLLEEEARKRGLDEPWSEDGTLRVSFILQVLGNLKLPESLPVLVRFARVVPHGVGALHLVEVLSGFADPKALEAIHHLDQRLGNVDETQLRRNHFPLPASLQDPRSYEDHLRRGEFNRLRSRHREAREDFGRAIPMHSNPFEALFRRGRIHLVLGQTEEALADALRARDLAPEEIEVQLTLGAVYHRLGRIEKALTHYSQASRIAPDDSRPPSYRAGLLAQIGRHELALREYDQAISLDPDRGLYYSNRAESLRILKRLDGARESARRGVELSPFHPHPYHVLGLIHRDSGQHELAIQHFTKAIRIGKRDTPILLDRGTVYGHLSRYGEAIQDFGLVLKQAPDHIQALLRRGHLHLLNRNRPAAVTDLTRVLALQPNHSSALELRFQALAQLGRHEEAVRDVRHFLGLEPDHPKRDQYLEYLKEQTRK